MTAVTQEVVDKVVGEVKAFGTNIKALEESTNKALAEVRGLIDEAGKKVDPLVTERVNKFAAEVEIKQEALEKGVKAALDGLEEVKAVQKRPNGAVSGDWADTDEGKLAKDAFEHAKTLAVMRGAKLGEKIEGNPESYAEYCEAISGYVRGRTDNVAHLAPKFQAALQTGNDPDGGYKVPQTMSSRVIGRVYETSALRQLATVETIGTKELVLPRDEGEFGHGGWVGETTAPSETNTSTFGESKISAFEHFCEPRVTQTMLEDAAFDVEGWVARKVGDKMGRIEATAFFTGNGVNKPRGILDYSAWAVAGTHENGKIEQFNSGSAAAVTTDGLYNLVFGLKDAYTGNAKFLMKRTTVRDILKLKDGNGQYIWQMGDIKAGQPSTILSYPVVRAEDMPTVEASALAIAFGDFAQAYTIVDRLGITLLRDNLTAKPYIKFYFRRRVGGEVVNFEAYKIQKIAA